MGAMGTGGGSSLAQQLQGMRPGDAQGADGGIGGSSSMPGSSMPNNQGRPPRPGSAAGRDPVAPRLAPIDPNAVGQMAPGPGSYGGFGAAPGPGNAGPAGGGYGQDRSEPHQTPLGARTLMGEGFAGAVSADDPAVTGRFIPPHMQPKAAPKINPAVLPPGAANDASDPAHVCVPRMYAVRASGSAGWNARDDAMTRGGTATMTRRARSSSDDAPPLFESRRTTIPGSFGSSFFSIFTTPAPNRMEPSGSVDASASARAP